MQKNKPLKLQRAKIVGGFFKLGFINKTAFKRVCLTLDSTLNGLDVANFYDGKTVTQKLINRLEAVLEMLRYE